MRTSPLESSRQSALSVFFYFYDGAGMDVIPRELFSPAELLVEQMRRDSRSIIIGSAGVRAAAALA